MAEEERGTVFRGGMERQSEGFCGNFECDAAVTAVGAEFQRDLPESFCKAAKSGVLSVAITKRQLQIHHGFARLATERYSERHRAVLGGHDPTANSKSRSRNQRLLTLPEYKRSPRHRELRVELQTLRNLQPHCDLQRFCRGKRLLRNFGGLCDVGESGLRWGCRRRQSGDADFRSTAVSKRDGKDPVPPVILCL